jgi:branched-chain amino acid transport system substrate-binding protein
MNSYSGRSGRAFVACVTVAALVTAACGTSASKPSSSKPSSSKPSATASSTSPASTSPASQLPAIKIGQIGQFSGPNASSTTPIEASVLAWSKFVNEHGGIGGRQVELFQEDDKGDAANSAAILKNLVENKGIVALVGAAGYTTDTSWAPYLMQKQVPVVGGSASTTIWSTSPMYFSTLSSEDARWFAFAKQAGPLGKTKGFVVYCAEFASCAGGVSFFKKWAGPAGAQNLGSAQVSATAPNYGATCLQIKSSGANFLVMDVTADVAERVAQACAQQGFNPTYSLANVSVTASMLALPEFQGSPVWTAAFPSTIPPAADYRAAMAQFAPSVPMNGAATTGWVSGIMFEAALQNASATGSITSQTVLDGLNSLRNNNLGGLLAGGIAYEAGVPHAQVPCVYALLIKSGQYVAQDQPICLPSS